MEYACTLHNKDDVYNRSKYYTILNHEKSKKRIGNGSKDASIEITKCWLKSPERPIDNSMNEGFILGDSRVYHSVEFKYPVNTKTIDKSNIIDSIHATMTNDDSNIKTIVEVMATSPVTCVYKLMPKTSFIYIRQLAFELLAMVLLKTNKGLILPIMAASGNTSTKREKYSDFNFINTSIFFVNDYCKLIDADTFAWNNFMVEPIDNQQRVRFKKLARIQILNIPDLIYSMCIINENPNTTVISKCGNKKCRIKNKFSKFNQVEESWLHSMLCGEDAIMIFVNVAHLCFDYLVETNVQESTLSKMETLIRDSYMILDIGIIGGKIQKIKYPPGMKRQRLF